VLGAYRIVGLLAVAGLLGAGQLLFKIAADRLVVGRGPAELAASFLSIPMLLAALVYALTTVLWVYLLHGIPLSRAYPFIALAFAMVPLLSRLVFGEPLDGRYLLGLAVMLAGLYLVSAGR
jgi:drug/metabolite transporter (DMT)-like permease